MEQKQWNEQTTCSEIVTCSFQSDREDVKSHNESGGRLNSLTTEINIVRVEEIIQNDRRVTVHTIASELGLSYGTLQHIISDMLQYSKVCSRWVPRVLSKEQKAT